MPDEEKKRKMQSKKAVVHPAITRAVDRAKGAVRGALKDQGKSLPQRPIDRLMDREERTKKFEAARRDERVRATARGESMLSIKPGTAPEKRRRIK